MSVEGTSIIGFYNSMMLLLTWGKPLREATVEEVFNNPYTWTFKKIEGTNNVDSFTDVSLLHERMFTCATSNIVPTYHQSGSERL